MIGMLCSKQPWSIVSCVKHVSTACRSVGKANSHLGAIPDSVNSYGQNVVATSDLTLIMYDFLIASLRISCAIFDFDRTESSSFNKRISSINVTYH